MNPTRAAAWRSLRFRFALWVAGLLLISLAAFGSFVYWSLARGLNTALDDSLQLSGAQVIAAVNIENGRFEFEDVALNREDAPRLDVRDLTIRLLSPAGEVLNAQGEYTGLPVSPASLAAARAQQPFFETVVPADARAAVRMYSAPVVENAAVIAIVQVAQTLEPIERTLQRLRQALLLGIPGLILLAAGGGYLLAARALAPIDQLTRTARRIAADPETLSARLNLPATDEVGRLAQTFDEMLAQLEASFRRERQFTADASHELRTPLAAMQAILSVMRQQRRTPDDYEAALADLAAETDRLRTLAEDLLHLARNGSRQATARTVIDLSTLLLDVGDSLRPLAEAKGLTLVGSVPGALQVVGDHDELIRLFVNLLDNAIKYTQHGGITVQGTRAGGIISIAITDSGVGIPAEHLRRVFDRFYRVDAARALAGTGLGLAIALQIARAHGGSIAVASVPSQGTTFTVRLPAVAK